jgi:hypothetical protein
MILVSKILASLAFVLLGVVLWNYRRRRQRLHRDQERFDTALLASARRKPPSKGRKPASTGRS